MEADTGLAVPFFHNQQHTAVAGFFPFGRVMYEHGSGIDAPLGVVRMEYSSELHDAQVIAPHADWRGSYDRGTTIFGSCVVYSSSGTMLAPPPDSTPANPDQYGGVAGGGTYNGTKEHCIDVDWPASYTYSALQYRRGYNGPDAWMGSLIFNQRDASGLYYRRNRYYDSDRGRFTQEDPVGLAAGTNVYGYAGGDPTMYNDPYGLCKVELQFTAAGVIGQHVTIVTTSPGGSHRFYSGGPTRERSQSLGASAGSAGSSTQSTGSAGASAQSPSADQGSSWNSSSPGAGPTNGEPDASFYGDVRVISGVYQPGIPEYQPTARRATVLNNRTSCDAVLAAFDAASRRINDANIPYNPFTQNSNSAAHYLIRSAGLNARVGLRVMAWDADLFNSSVIMPKYLGIGLGGH